MKNILKTTFLASVILLSGCASVIKGTEQNLTFRSNVDDATVLIDGISMGLTPLTIKVKKNNVSSVMIKKKGYKTQVLPLNKEYDGVALLSVFWDLSTTDVVTGAAWEYHPNTFYFELQKKKNK